MAYAISRQTEGDFLLSLAKLSKEYRLKGHRSVLKTLVPQQAAKHGIDIDPDGPHDELELVVKPLVDFLEAVVGGDADLLTAVACTRLAYEGHTKYLQQRDSRLRISARLDKV